MVVHLATANRAVRIASKENFHVPGITYVSFHLDLEFIGIQSNSIDLSEPGRYKCTTIRDVANDQDLIDFLSVRFPSLISKSKSKHVLLQVYYRYLLTSVHSSCYRVAGYRFVYHLSTREVRASSIISGRILRLLYTSGNLTNTTAVTTTRTNATASDSKEFCLRLCGRLTSGGWLPN